MTRDLRDPQKLGETILNEVYATPTKIRATIVYDHYLDLYDPIPDYSHSESMCDLTKREYRAELEARAAEGDKYAASALADLNAGKKVQNDDPAGS